MKNFIQPGNVVDIVAAGTVTSGSPMIANSLFGVATIAGTVGQSIPCVVEGIVEVNKDTNLVINQGDRLFWVPGSSWVNKTTTAQTCVGVAVEGALLAATKVKMKIGAYTPAGT